MITRRLRARACQVSLLLWCAGGARDNTFGLGEASRSSVLSMDGSGHMVNTAKSQPKKTTTKKPPFAGSTLVMPAMTDNDPQRHLKKVRRGLQSSPSNGVGPGDSTQTGRSQRDKQTTYFSRSLSESDMDEAAKDGVKPLVKAFVAPAWPDTGLRIHAASFNAGNEKYKLDGGGFEDLLQKMSSGHEEADIVVFGFQEFHDEHFGLAERARKLLWQDRTQAKVESMVEEIRGTPGQDVHEDQATVQAYLEQADANTKKFLEGVSKEAQQLFAPVTAWEQGRKKMIQDVVKKYPSLKFTRDGAARLGEFTSSFAHVQEVSRLVQARVQVLRSVAAGKLTRNEDETVSSSQTLLDDWERLQDALTKMQHDLAGNKLNACEGCKWKDGVTKESAGLVRDPAQLQLGAADIVVDMDMEFFNSGRLCHSPVTGTAHYDTMLYVYVNPWSEWQIKQEAYVSDPCKAHGEHGQGCTINNNDPLECGKVVNMLVYVATQGAEKIRFCAMNTHMSFDGTSQKRMSFIRVALEQAKDAACEYVVFVGDFNSRITCKLPTDSAMAEPACESTGSSANSLEHILDLFKEEEPALLHGKPKTIPRKPREVSLSPYGGKEDGWVVLYDRPWSISGASLTGTNSQMDELKHLLTQAQVTCFDEHTTERNHEGTKEKVWKIKTFHNELLHRGLMEGEVEFNPTYKLYAEEDIKRKHLTILHCVKGMKKCYANEDAKGKHNPAWTDRILVQAQDGGFAEVVKYWSAETSEATASDHLPVMASVVFHPRSPTTPNERHPSAHHQTS